MPGVPVQSSVDDRGFHVKQVLRSGSAPSHLMLLAHAPVDQLIDGALNMRGRNGSPFQSASAYPLTDSRFAYNRSEARLASLRYFQTVHCLLLGVPRRAERDQSAPWSFPIPPYPHRRSRASTSCCSSLPSERRGVPGNHPHRGDPGIPFRFARSVAQHGTNPDVQISRQFPLPPSCNASRKHRSGRRRTDRR